MSTRRDICIACDLSESDGVAYLACERMHDVHVHLVPCMLTAALRDPQARCPHPDEAQARRWNEAAVYVAPGCGQQAAGAQPRVASGAANFLTLRVRACLGNGEQQGPCPHAGPGWWCGLEGRSIRTELRDPGYACKDGRFAAVQSREGLSS